MSADLRSLCNHPFELLRELERRGRLAAVGAATDEAAGEEWIGIAIRVGDQRLLVARDEVREVLPLPVTTRVPGAVSWVRGIANVRGQLLPVSDLAGFLETAPASRGRSARVVVVNHRSIPAGVIVDEVYGFRRFVETEREVDPGTVEAAFAPFVTGAFRRADEVSVVISLKRIVESERFLQAAE